MAGFHAAGTAASGTLGLVPATPYVSMLTLEDGSIVANADTYALEATIATHATRYGRAWSGADLAKEQAILRAMSFIERLEPRFWGWRVSSAQSLSWPRYGVPDGAGDYILQTTIPGGLVRALCEAAILELATPGVMVAPSNTTPTNVRRKRDKVGPLEKEIEYAGGVSLAPRFDTVMAFLRPYLKNAAFLLQH